MGTHRLYRIGRLKPIIALLRRRFISGKGFGRPAFRLWRVPGFAVTGQVDVPRFLITSFDVTLNAFIGEQLVYGGIAAIQYARSQSEIIDLGLPDFINHLIPIPEASLTTPIPNNFGNPYTTTGTVNPGVIWVGSYFQVGLEAMVPINRQSGTGVGVIGQLHLYLDDMFPSTIGQPLFGGTSSTRKLTF